MNKYLKKNFLFKKKRKLRSVAGLGHSIHLSRDSHERGAGTTRSNFLIHFGQK
jgi:hypothetical protein